jgi:2-polyprenyl-3-methyl-5-hydroxy-6-metoxy-1,4-benzoquinol methylase
MFLKRSFQSELLDESFIPQEDLYRNLYELEVINTYLGGYAITNKGLSALLANHSKVPQTIRIVDIGSGGGDTLRKMAIWCKKHHIKAELIGIDLKEDCIRYAQSKSKDFPEISFIQSDYKNIHLDADIFTSALFCHHLSDDELIFFLEWSQKNARLGFIVNDLHRHFLAYHSIKLLTKFFSRSYLVKNDAPLSVKRSLAKKDWENILQKAQIRDYNISWQWAFRWLIVGRTST